MSKVSFFFFPGPAASAPSQIDLAANIAVTTSTPNIDVAVQGVVVLSAAIPASSQTPSVDASLRRNLSASVAAPSSTGVVRQGAGRQRGYTTPRLFFFFPGQPVVVPPGEIHLSANIGAASSTPSVEVVLGAPPGEIHLSANINTTSSTPSVEVVLGAPPGEIHLSANIGAASSTPSVEVEIPGVAAPDTTNIPMRRRRFYASTEVAPTPDISGIRLRARVAAVSSTPAIGFTTTRNLRVFIRVFTSAGRRFIPDWHEDTLPYRNVVSFDFSVAATREADLAIESVHAEAFGAAVEQQDQFAVAPTNEARLDITVGVETELDLMVMTQTQVEAGMDHEERSAISESAAEAFGITIEQGDAFDR